MSETSSSEGPKLSEIYDDIWKTYEFLENCEESTNSDVVQDKVKACLEQGEKAIRMVNDIRLFSDNEEIEEVSTNEIKYILLPALMAYVTMKQVKQDRMEAITKAKTYYVDFLRMCKSYGVTQINIPVDEAEDGENKLETRSAGSRPDLQAMTSEREAKMRRYREKMEMEQRLGDLHKAVQKDHVDDEVKRDYYITTLKRWVNLSIEEIDSIHSEIPILEHMAKMKNKSGTGDTAIQPTAVPKQKQTPLRPFIITKDVIQKQVFGLGYPSIPTVTLDEFYEQKLRDGTWQPPSSGTGNSMMDRANNPEMDKHEREMEDVEKEEKAEREDPEQLTQQRGWDDWKDDNRRGWGNRAKRL